MDETKYPSKRLEILNQSLFWFLEKTHFGVSLAELAKKMNLSEWECNHLFLEYTQKSPERLSLDISQIGNIQIENKQPSLFDVVSNPKTNTQLKLVLKSILEDPITLFYTRFPHFLGEIFIAATETGICQITFEATDNGFERLKKQFPESELIEESSELIELCYTQMIRFFDTDSYSKTAIPLEVKASNFQIKCWKALIEIPFGKCVNYSSLSPVLSDPKLARAIGTAIGQNPIALLIPCHRVVAKNGKIGHFRWGSALKSILLAIEKNE